MHARALPMKYGYEMILDKNAGPAVNRISISLVQIERFNSNYDYPFSNKCLDLWLKFPFLYVSCFLWLVLDFNAFFIFIKKGEKYYSSFFCDDPIVENSNITFPNNFYMLKDPTKLFNKYVLIITNNDNMVHFLFLVDKIYRKIEMTWMEILILNSSNRY